MQIIKIDLRIIKYILFKEIFKNIDIKTVYLEFDENFKKSIKKSIRKKFWMKK